MKYSSKKLSNYDERKTKKTGSVIKMNRKPRNIRKKRKDAKIILERVTSEKPTLLLSKASQIANITLLIFRRVYLD